ncbi:MAG: FAD-linked oxidase C-terminal domain-containing protein [Cyclobacteriaceae bacterium]
MINSDKIQRLKNILVSGRLLTSPGHLIAYESDALGYKTFTPDAVAIPSDTNELTDLVGALRDLDIPWVIRGAGSSLSGGPIAAQGGVVIHLSKLKSILEINIEEGYAVVECGVTLNQLNNQLKPYQFYYPPDPSSGTVSTIGGNVACNAGGVHCFRYGVTSNYVLGLETILLDGSTVRFGGPAGGRGKWNHDWKRLFVGSEGTLGVLTKLWLRIISQAEKVWTFRATYSDIDKASKAIQKLSVHSAFPAAIEFMDPRAVDLVENSPWAVGLPSGSYMILTEIDGPRKLVDSRVESIVHLLKHCGASDVVYSDDEKSRTDLWKARKAIGGLLGQISPNFIVQDAVIPKKDLKEILEFIYKETDNAGVRVAIVMHAGDGNLHPNFLFNAEKTGELEAIEEISKKLMYKVMELGGTLSGEHGIGNDKSIYTTDYFGELGKKFQMAVSSVFNPKNQLNPLKIFPERRFT